MSENYTESYGDDGQYDDQGGTQQADQGRNPLREQMKRMERDMKALREQADAGSKATRTLEFVKAGIDVNSPQAKYFVNGYDGDLTTDAIKAAAEEAGFLGTPPPPVPTAQDQADQQVFQQSPAAMAGGTGDGARDWDAEIASAKDEDEVIRIYRERHGQDSVKND